MTYRIPRRLGWVVVPPTETDVVAAYLMQLPDGDPQALYGTAALIWALAAEGEPDVAASLADLLAMPGSELRAHVDDYLRELVESGLLEQSS